MLARILVLMITVALTGCASTTTDPATAALTDPAATSVVASPPPKCAENGSCYGDVSTETGKLKTIFVPGHTGDDGVYVKSSYESAP